MQFYLHAALEKLVLKLKLRVEVGGTQHPYVLEYTSVFSMKPSAYPFLDLKALKYGVEKIRTRYIRRWTLFFQIMLLRRFFRTECTIYKCSNPAAFKSTISPSTR